MSDTIDSLSIQIESDAGKASGGLDKLLNTLNGIKAAVAPVTAELDKLRASISALSTIKTAIDANPVRKTLKDITAAVRTVTDDDIARLSKVGTAMQQMTSSFSNTSALDGASLDSFTTSISNLSTVVKSIDDETLDKLSALGFALNELRNVGSVRLDMPTVDTASDSGASGFLSGLKKNSSAFASGIFGTFGGALKTAYGGTAAVFKGLSSSLTWFTEKINPANGALGTFVKGLGRIAKYRLLRTIIKEITSGASEGLQNLAHASSEANAVLSQLSSAALTLKNSMGGMLYSAIEPNIGILTGLANAAVRAMDALSQLFAILGGRSTYKKATTATQSYADALKGATGRARAFKQELMGFDEINALSPDNDYGGGGRGGVDDLNYGAMFQEAPVSEWLRSMVNAGNFSALGVMIADKINSALGNIDWNRVKGGARKLASSLTTLINGFFSEMDPMTWGKTIGELINTATTFVGNFWRDTDWFMIGKRVQSMITNALFTIDAKQLAEALMGKFRSLVSFLNGLLPDTMGEWKVITDRVTEFIGYAIERIPVDGLGELLSSLLMGGLSLIRSLAEDFTLTKIVNAIKDTLEAAAKRVTPEDMKSALSAIKDDILEALKAAFSITFNIGDAKINAAGLVITAAAVYTAIKGALKGIFSGTGFMSSASGLLITGGIAFAVNGFMSLNGLKEDINNGTGVTPERVASILSSALESAGLFLMYGGHPVAGAIVFGIGLAIQPIVQRIEEMVSASAESMVDVVFGPDFQAETDEAISKAKEVSDVLPIFEDLIGKKIGLQEFYTVLDYGMGGIRNYDGAVDTIDEARVAIGNLLGEYGMAKATGATWNQFVDTVLEKLGIVSGDTQSATGFTQTFIDTLNSTSGAASAFTQNVGGVASAIGETVQASNDLNGVDMTNIQNEFGDVSNAAKNATPNITALGDEAEDVGMKVVEIPTERAIAIEITNYTTLISNLENIKKNIDRITTEKDIAIDVKDYATLDSNIDTIKTDIEEITADRAIAIDITNYAALISNLGSIKTKLDEITTSVNILWLKIAGDLTMALTEFQYKISGDVNGALISFRNTADTVISTLSSLQRAINSLHGANLYINVYAGLSSGAKNFLYQLGNVDSSVRRKVNALVSASQFASGGYPESGELFIANENGRQEMVGRIGNRAAVANQDQIGDAIFRYMDEHDREGGDGPTADEIGAAVASALKRAGIGSVYLDGRDMARAINRGSKQAGRPLIEF